MRKAEALKTWQAAGLLAWNTLEPQIKAEMEATGQIPMADADPVLGREVVREIRRAPNPVAHIHDILIATTKDDLNLTPTQKRLRFRQNLIAAGLISGNHRSLHEYVVTEAEDLNLEPLDMKWVRDLPGGNPRPSAIATTEPEPLAKPTPKSTTRPKKEAATPKWQHPLKPPPPAAQGTASDYDEFFSENCAISVTDEVLAPLPIPDYIDLNDKQTWTAKFVLPPGQVLPIHERDPATEAFIKQVYPEFDEDWMTVCEKLWAVVDSIHGDHPSMEVWRDMPTAEAITSNASRWEEDDAEEIRRRLVEQFVRNNQKLARSNGISVDT